MYGTGSSFLDYTGALQYVDGDDFNLDDSIVTYDVKLITSAGCTKMLSQTKDLVSCCAAISTDATDLMSTNSLGGVHAFVLLFFPAEGTADRKLPYIFAEPRASPDGTSVSQHWACFHTTQHRPTVRGVVGAATA